MQTQADVSASGSGYCPGQTLSHEPFSEHCGVLGRKTVRCRVHYYRRRNQPVFSLGELCTGEIAPYSDQLSYCGRLWMLYSLLYREIARCYIEMSNCGSRWFTTNASHHLPDFFHWCLTIDTRNIRFPTVTFIESNTSTGFGTMYSKI